MKLQNKVNKKITFMSKEQFEKLGDFRKRFKILDATDNGENDQPIVNKVVPQVKEEKKLNEKK